MIDILILGARILNNGLEFEVCPLPFASIHPTKKSQRKEYHLKFKNVLDIQHFDG